jgi:hypothetical protein
VASLHPIEGSRNPRHPADLNDAMAPGTRLLPLPARLIGLPLT